jgi:putative ABC transport system substrate-binding protein
LKAKILVGLAALVLSSAHLVSAQQSPKKIPVIGVFLPDTAAAYKSYVETFLRGLHELGYVVGQNILIEYRYADGKRDRFSELATSWSV